MNKKDINQQINTLQNKLKRIGEYDKVVDAIVPLVRLAEELSVKADIDNGEDKKTLRMVYADLATIQSVIKDSYSNTADMITALRLKTNIED